MTPAKAGNQRAAEIFPGPGRGQQGAVAESAGCRARGRVRVGVNMLSRSTRDKLGHRIGIAGAERGLVAARPDAAPVGHDEQHPPVAGQHPPQLAQGRAQLLAVLDGVDGEDAVDRRIGQRQVAVVGQRGGAGAVRGPVQHPLGRWHDGDDTRRLAAERLQIGCGIADAEYVEPAQAPATGRRIAARIIRRATSPRLLGIEVAQVDHVVPHGVTTITLRAKGLARSAR